MTKTILLGEVAEIIKGISYRSADYSNSENGIAFVNLKSVARGGGYNADGIKYYAGQIKPSQYVEPGDILIANTDLTQNREIIGSPIIMPNIGRSACFSLDLSKIVVTDTDIVNHRYLFYYLKSPIAREYMLAHSNGSTVMHLSVKAVPNMKLNLPPLDQQKKIANILSSLDEKIELNRRMNEILEQLGQTLFRHYFVDNPAAVGWKSGTLGDIIVNFDSKRKPLSSRQRAKMQGDYRYFGATSVMDHVNDYLFDGTYLLLAEDGSVMRSDGTPYLQYVWGRFWINNHAHIIQAKYPFTVEYLYLLLAKTNVQSLVSGAVQLKINQRAMNSLVISIPPDDLVIKFCNLVNSLFAQYRENEGQIELLVNLRDSLLPKLISGEVEI